MLAFLRRELRLNQEQLAARAGLTLSRLKKLEDSFWSATACEIDRLARALGVPEYRLVNG